ncbi:MAG TPA: tetratricopeptide repeat protein [Candidatus Eisenbacteria bacterium]|nr:tetratricopeptide repeat protein [Candidatus Eisenbacteria bacterium]
MSRRVQSTKSQQAPGGAERRAASPQARPGARGISPPITWLLAAIVLAAALLPYWSSLGFEFVWDDPYVIGPHLDVRSPGDLVRIWKIPFDVLLKDEAMTRTYFRPVSLYSFSLDRALGGDDPRGYHAQNLFWHATACLFLWLLAWEISGRPIASAAGAAIFALHPTHPENVAFVSGRTDLLAGAFLFASLWAAARLGPDVRDPWRKLAPAALLLAPGIFAKEVALFGAPLLPLVLWLRDRRAGWGVIARASVPVLAVVVLYLIARVSVLGPTPLPSIAPVQGAAAQLLTSVAIVARYLALLFVPVGLSARHEVSPSTSPDPVFVAGLLALAALVAGLVVTARRRSLWLLPLALFAATLLPLCWVRILAGALVAERFLYVPSGALALAVALLPGALAARGARSEKRDAGVKDATPGLLLGAGALAVWFLSLLAPRVAIWKDEGTLYTAMLRDTPGSPHVHGMAGGYYHRQGDRARAAQHYRRAYELYPQSGEMLLNLVAVEDESGQTDSAFVHARKLLHDFPHYAAGWYALGNLHVRVDQPDSARLAYEEALRLQPDLAPAENNLGAVLERLGRYDEALERYRHAGMVQPGFPEAARNVERLSSQIDSLRAAAAP